VSRGVDILASCIAAAPIQGRRVPTLHVKTKPTGRSGRVVNDMFSKYVLFHKGHLNSWWRGTVVERRSLAGELSLSCARPAADG